MMKKSILSLATIALIVTGIFTFVGCEKEEESKTDNLKNSPTTAYDEVVNPDETELLDRSYTVAVYDGEQFQLTFPKDAFLQNFENYLNSHSGEQYVAEDVSIFHNDVFEYPLLDISYFNVEKNEGHRMYCVLSSNGMEGVMDGAWEFQGASAVTTKCISKNCDTPRKGGCNPDKGKDGSLLCSPCPNPFGECSKETTSTGAIQALCYSLSTL